MLMPLSLALAGLGGDVKKLIVSAGELGYRALQLDGTSPGTRARELDRSARRDLAATLKRAGLGMSGIDLWIPPAHFVEAAFLDRAVTAVEQAIHFAAEVAGLMGDDNARVVSLMLPKEVSVSVERQIDSWCAMAGVRVADHAYPARARQESMIGVGFDPTASILAGKDAVEELIKLGRRPDSARLADLSALGRIVPGSAGGRLDAPAYFAALSAVGYERAVAADVRGFQDPAKAAGEIAARFAGSGARG